MPKIMGVLTHLDMIKNNKLLKQTKKVLKHRFWTEVYPGAKLFYLSTILHGEYLRAEIERLGRFISVMKFRPLGWQTSHPYILGKIFAVALYLYIWVALQKLPHLSDTHFSQILNKLEKNFFMVL